MPWRPVQTSDGRTYMWNTDTDEVRWERHGAVRTTNPLLDRLWTRLKEQEFDAHRLAEASLSSAATCALRGGSDAVYRVSMSRFTMHLQHTFLRWKYSPLPPRPHSVRAPSSATDPGNGHPPRRRPCRAPGRARPIFRAPYQASPRRPPGRAQARLGGSNQFSPPGVPEARPYETTVVQSERTSSAADPCSRVAGTFPTPRPG